MQPTSPESPTPVRPHVFMLAGAFTAGLLLCMHAGCGDEPGAPTPDAGQEGRQVRVQLLAINDFHGNLEPPTGSSGQIKVGTLPDGGSELVNAGGVSYLARHIAVLRATNPNTVVVSAGDLIGATPLLSALFHDEPTIEAMNELGLDLNAVGNHEFDEGGSELLRMQAGGCHPVDGCQDGTPFAGASFKFLAANVATGISRTLFPRYDIREFEGVKVAFIGMTLEGTPEIVTPTAVAGLTFRDEVETVNELVPELKRQGASAIVVVVHEGGLQTGLYNQCEGISGAIVDMANGVDDEVDVIVSGHTHAAYNCVIDGKLVTSAASFGRLVTDIDLTLDAASGNVVEARAHNVIVTRDVPPSTALTELVSRYDSLAAPLRDRVIGYAETTMQTPRNAALPSGESTLGDVIADAQLDATDEPNLGNAVIAFMNPGGIRADLLAGEVTYGEVFTIQPFGNTLVTMTLTGAQIDTLLEQQWSSSTTRILQVSRGFAYTWKASAPVGSRVDPSTITLNGKTLDPNDTYRITVNNFIGSGGDGFTVLTQGTGHLGGAVDVDALEAYLRANNPLAAPALGRITRVD